jgi:hypothetical protein
MPIASASVGRARFFGAIDGFGLRRIVTGPALETRGLTTYLVQREAIIGGGYEER